jgi:hypothetical protein
MMVGRAVTNVFDGNKVFGDANDPTTFRLKGIPAQSEIGFLTLLEALPYSTVGEYLKSPKFPISWIIGSSNHYTVMFAHDRHVGPLTTNQKKHRAARSAFDQLDPEKNGFIPVTSLNALLSKLSASVLPPGVTPDEVKRRLDPDGLLVSLHLFPRHRQAIRWRRPQLRTATQRDSPTVSFLPTAHRLKPHSHTTAAHSHTPPLTRADIRTMPRATYSSSLVLRSRDCRGRTGTSLARCSTLVTHMHTASHTCTQRPFTHERTLTCVCTRRAHVIARHSLHTPPPCASSSSALFSSTPSSSSPLAGPPSSRPRSPTPSALVPSRCASSSCGPSRTHHHCRIPHRRHHSIPPYHHRRRRRLSHLPSMHSSLLSHLPRFSATIRSSSFA